MFYGEIRSYTERIWHVYGRIRHRIRSFTTVYRVRNRRPGRTSMSIPSQARADPGSAQILGLINEQEELVSLFIYKKKV